MARKRDDTVKLVLRLPPALHQRLGHAAARGRKSLNSEMIRRLEQSFELPRQAEALATAARDEAANKMFEGRIEEALAKLVGDQPFSLGQQRYAEVIRKVGDKRYRFISEDRIERVKDAEPEKGRLAGRRRHTLGGVKGEEQ
jgi:Arc-like DNA binding domain